jgi:hypothetical protein
MISGGFVLNFRERDLKALSSLLYRASQAPVDKLKNYRAVQDHLDSIVYAKVMEGVTEFLGKANSVSVRITVTGDEITVDVKDSAKREL